MEPQQQDQYNPHHYAQQQDQINLEGRIVEGRIGENMNHQQEQEQYGIPYPGVKQEVMGTSPIDVGYQTSPPQHKMTASVS